MEFRRAVTVAGKNVRQTLKRQSLPSQNCQRRSMATEAPLPASMMAQAYEQTGADLPSTPSGPTQNPFITSAQCLLYDFPALEPTGFVAYPSTHLLLPLRKDILHKAVIYEGDMTRMGTASTKHRSEVHGSNRKVRPQKGTGSARLGDKKSPMLRGGGVAFGPKPRDFSTELPRKIYDLAWRTALSYRYAKGELMVVEGEADIDVHEDSAARYMRDMMVYNHIGHANRHTLFVTKSPRKLLTHGMKDLETHGRVLPLVDVDVKDLLELGRVVIEKEALDSLFHQHQSDLANHNRLNNWLASMQDKPIVDSAFKSLS